jgi:hypothetical protein
MVKVLKTKCGVVVNRALAGRTEVRHFCQQARLPILAEIPDDMSIAQAYSEGKLVVETLPWYRRTFAKLLRQIAQMAAPEFLQKKIGTVLDSMDRSAVENKPPNPVAEIVDRPVCYLALRSKNTGNSPKAANPGRTL